MSFPPPDAKYSEIQAWHVRHSLSSVPRRDWPKCAACETRTNAQPLTMRTRIRFSAKYKDRVFEPGQVLCSGHSTEALESPKAVAIQEATETWHAFAGNEYCSAACRGWNGTDQRCDCGNRRVYWDTSTTPPFARADSGGVRDRHTL